MVVAQCLQTERCSEISSSLCFSCAMMGLQATSGKRKLEGGVGCMDFDMELGESPSKLGRIESGSWWAMEDSYTSLTSLTSSNSPSSPPSTSSSSLTTSSSVSVVTSPATPPSTGLSQSSGGGGGGTAATYYDMEVVASSCLQSSTSLSSPCQLSPASAPSVGSAVGNSSSPQTTSQQASPMQATPPHQQTTPSQSQHYYQRTTYQHRVSQWGHHANAPHHYEPPTIRREENGKSYLELGSSYRANERCCEGSRSSWCRRGRACYRQRRLAVLNISMCKLARYRQFPDPSLHRSVLICNTLRYLEREMERDRSPPPMEPVMHAPIAQLQPPEQGRLTPFPLPVSSSAETDVDSGIGDSDDSRSINWGSVLSLSSQSPLDPLNNNELLDVDIGPDLDLDFMPGWKLTPLTSNASTTTSTTADELLRSTADASSMPHHLHNSSHLQQQPQHHHHHHQLAASGCSNASAASNGSNHSSSTHESLMCVGS